MTRIEWDPKARDFLRKLPKDVARRIGDYRLFADYYKDKEVLVIRSIRHRRDAYKAR